MWKKPKVWVPAIVVLLFLIIILQNTDVVTLRIFFWKREMSQVILIPLVLAIGFVAGFAVAKIFGKGRAALDEPQPPPPTIP